MIRELQYPFDADFIMSKKKSLRHRLLESSDSFSEKKIAVLGGSTTHDIKLVLELFLLNRGIRPVFYESEYNRYYEESVFTNAKLEEFAPDIIYIHTTNRNISAYPEMNDNFEKAERMLQDEYKRFSDIWDRLSVSYGCPIIQNNFELPFYRMLGNKDASDIHGAVHFVSRLNMLFYEYAQKHDNFFICDINYISADYGLGKWSDPFYYYMYKYALNVSAIPFLAHNIANIILSVFGKNKKGFVTDLDNTLWGGEVGEAGADGIVIGAETPEGEAYVEFQKYLKRYSQLGVVLNISSKNEKRNALDALNHPDGVLKPEDFIMIKANWEPKDRNFSSIAAQLELLPESLVFIDDNPAERHLVECLDSGIAAPDIGEVHQYISRIDRSGYFETTIFSGDDAKRDSMYKENEKRILERAAFTDYGEYLKSLQMRAAVKAFEPAYLARIVQLVNKCNQFNLTARKYTLAEIERISCDNSYVTLYAKLSDRFGDNGVVSALIGCITDGICHIELWIMSCRVLKRDVESAVMDMLVKSCLERGIKELRGYYNPTQKNGMVRKFYATQGFEKIHDDETGCTVWKYTADKTYENRNRYIRLENGK